MANFTTHYNLRQPIDDEFFDVVHANDNMTIIDNALKAISDVATNGVAQNADDIADAVRALQQSIGDLNFNQLILENQTMDTGLSLGDCISNNGTKWIKTATPEGVYLGNNVVAISGLIKLSGFSLDSGHTYFAQADGRIGLGVTAYPVGKAVSVNQLILDFNPLYTYPLAYNGTMIQFYAISGASGKVRLKVANAGLSDGVMIRRKTSAWGSGDTKSTGTLVATITNDSAYSGNNEWFEDSGLVSGTTYYYKAFPYKGSIYNETIGVNETYARAGLMLHEYTADNVSGNTIIDTAGSNNAISTSVAFTDGKVGTAATGTGSGRASISSVSMAGKSIEFWINHDLSGRCGVIGGGARYNLSVYADDSELKVGHFWHYQLGSFQGASITLQNGWNHIVINFTSTTNATIYRNGVQVYSGSIYGTFTNMVDTISYIYRTFVDAEDSDSNYYLNGQIDQLRFYSTLLTLVEVQRLYNGGVGC